MSVKQNTLKGEFSLKGKGLHTGKEVCATFKPAAENTGYKIVRVDLDEKTEIPALAKYIELVDRASCLQKDGAKVYTLEHAMAALYGCGIDNCVIELSGEEFPILDGSARYYVEEIQKVGIEEQQAERRYFSVKKKMEFYCEASDTRITLLPDDTYSINTMVAYDSPYLAMQFASYSEASTDFAKEIAPCRTFVFLREVEMLLANNLIKGGDLSNAIVIVDRKMDQPEIDRLAKLFGYGNIQIKEGVLNNLELYFDNEPARHKLLDVIGDLALCGRFIKGRVIAERPGHKANTSMAKMIYKEILAENNIEFDENLIFETDYSYHAGETIWPALAAAGVTAAYVGDDRLAAGVLNSALDAGVKVPEEFELVTSNNSEITQMVRPKLSSITQPLYDIGAVSMRYLTKMMNKEEDVEEDKTILLPYGYVKRASTK